jgi:hypothetical protein
MARSLYFIVKLTLTRKLAANPQDSLIVTAVTTRKTQALGPVAHPALTEAQLRGQSA